MAANERMGFRTDIEGLRGVAVLLVILFHVGLSSFTGGYIGVDVFFVISGFLISGLLLRELRTTDRVGLAAFWARRLRRLVPALVVAVAATLLAGLVVYSPLGWKDLGRDATAAVLYVSNIVFAQDGAAYFQSGTSPLLHTWSLGVEEQFYLAWPLLFLGVALVAGRARRASTGALTGALVLVALASFGLAVVLTDRGTPWAFYGAPTRAWEFAIGGLLAVHYDRIRALRAPLWSVAGWLGLAMIVVAGVRFDAFTAFPGPAAALPVLGAALVLAPPRTDLWWAPGRTLSFPPLRYVGRVSYSWYLWHWPAIVLADAQWGPLDAAGKSVAALVSFGCAAVSYRFVEQPVRTAPLVARPRRAYLGAAAVSGAVVVMALGVSWQAERELDDPFLAMLASARGGRTTAASANCGRVELAPGVRQCVHGDAQSERTFVLVGDSHAAQWSAAVEAVAADLDARLLIRSFGGCPSMDVFIAKTGGRTASSTCLAFRRQTRALIDAVAPDLVIVANTRYSDRTLRSAGGGLLDPDDADDVTAAALTRYARELTGDGITVAVIQDNPSMKVDPIECLAKERSADECSPAASDVLPALERHLRLEQQAMQSGGVRAFFDTSELMCDDDRCWVQRDGTLVFSDPNHLFRTFVLEQVPRLREFLRGALDARAPAVLAGTDAAP